MVRVVGLALVAALMVSACEQGGGGVLAEIEAAEAKAAKAKEVNLEASKTFVAQAAKREGWTQTKSGMVYRITKTNPADLPRPTAESVVLADYEGKLIDGKVFDSSFANGQPASFPLNQVVPGWTEALQLIKPGEEMEIVLPPELGYGERGAGEGIGPNQALQFRIVLHAFRGADGQIYGTPPAPPPPGGPVQKK